MNVDMSEGGNVTQISQVLITNQILEGSMEQRVCSFVGVSWVCRFKMISGNGTVGTLGTIFNLKVKLIGGDMITYNPLFSTTLEIIRFTMDKSRQIKYSVKLEVDGEISGSTIRGSGDVIKLILRMKITKHIVQIENPLEKMESIGGYEFDWNNNQQIYHR